MSILLLCALASVTQAQQAGSEGRLRGLERKLEEATRQIELLTDTVRALRAEVGRLEITP